jgi:hypothetical protein
MNIIAITFWNQVGKLPRSIFPKGICSEIIELPPNMQYLWRLIEYFLFKIEVTTLAP